jgi:hypothetical protein
MAAIKLKLVRPKYFVIHRPVCPGVEGEGPGMWAWDKKLERWMYTVTDEEMVRGRKERQARERQTTQPLHLIKNTSSTKDIQEFIVAQIMKADERQLVRILRTLRFICHPDHGGSHEAMIKLNQLYDSLKD